MNPYAIIASGGRQWKVESGSRLEINRLDRKVGSDHAVEQVLLARDGDRVHIGQPFVSGAKVVFEVVEHRRGPKVITYYFRRRERWRRTVGHRQPLTKLIVKEIHLGGTRTAKKSADSKTETPSQAKKKA